MFIVYMVLALLINIALHEAGHAITLSRRGIKLEEFGLGFGPRIATWSPAWLEGPIQLRLIPLGGYVKPVDTVENDPRKLSYKDQATCYGMGVTINLLIALATLFADQCYLLVVTDFKLFHVWLAGGCLALGGLIALARRVFCAYVLPFLSIGQLIAIVWGIVSNPRTAVSGPVTFFTTGAKFSSDPAITQITLALIVVAIGLASLNMLPLQFLDGGHIAEAILTRLRLGRWIPIWQAVSTGLLMVLLSLGLINDLLNFLP